MKMRIKMADGTITLIECSPAQAGVIKSWGRMEYNRKTGTFTAPIGDEILNKRHDKGWLPQPYELERQRRIRVRAAVDKERIKDDPRPAVHFPVKASLYKHQVRAANMALITFGLIPPEAAYEKTD